MLAPPELKWALVPVVLLASISWGCGGSSPEGRLEVIDPLVGEAPAGADAALYFDVVVDADDALIGVETPLADTIVLHELRAVEGGGIMWPVERIELVAGETAELRPFGSHVMLEGIHDGLEAGEQVEFLLIFDDRAPVAVVAEVVPLYELAERYEGDN